MLLKLKNDPIHRLDILSLCFVEQIRILSQKIENDRLNQT